MTFAERFPLLELLTHIDGTTAKLPDIPAKIEDVDVLYVVGARKLDQFKEFVKKGKLVIIEERLSHIAALKKEKVVTHPNVDIVHMTKSIEQTAHELAQKYPMRHIEVVGDFMKEALFCHTTVAHTFLCEDLYRHKLLRNLITNYRRIPGSFDVGQLRMNVPAIICGAGPSLDPNMIASFKNRALIIGGGSAIPVLGKTLDLAIAFDPNEEEYHRLKKGIDVPLVYGARLHPKVFESLRGPRGYMRTGTGGEIDLWLEEELGLSPIMSKLDFGKEAMSVTTMAIALAASMGCSPIILAGCDFALTNGREYASGVKVNALHEGVAEKILNQTRVKWLLESRAIQDYINRHPEIEWINASPNTLTISNKIPDLPIQNFDLHSHFVPITASVTRPLSLLRESLIRCKTLPELLQEDELAYRLLLKPMKEAQQKINRNTPLPLDEMIASW